MIQDDELRALFEVETREHLPALERGLQHLISGQGDPATLQDLFRAAHSLKAAAGIMGGFEASWAKDGVEALRQLETGLPDVVVTDVNMPGMESAYSDGQTVNRVFQAGGDDYVYKPVVGPELRTRVSNRLERSRVQATGWVEPPQPARPQERPDLALVVDDEELGRELLELSELGFRVEHFSGGIEELLHRLTDEVHRRPRVILLQDLDSGEVLGRLASLGVTSHCQVWVRGRLSEEDQVWLFEHRGAGYIPEAVPRPVLRRRLEQLLRPG